MRFLTLLNPYTMPDGGSMWLAMRQGKHDRRQFKPIRFPPFIDKEPPLDYGDSVLSMDPLEAIQLDLEDAEDAPIIEWFYDPHTPITSVAMLEGQSADIVSLLPLPLCHC